MEKTLLDEISESEEACNADGSDAGDDMPWFSSFFSSAPSMRQLEDRGIAVSNSSAPGEVSARI